jgi:hypothetical protein
VAAKTGTTLTLSGFAAGDTLMLTTFKDAGAIKLTFAENKTKTAGILTIQDGALTAKITLFGQYTAAGFHHAAAGAGTAITYARPAAHLELAAAPK